MTKVRWWLCGALGLGLAWNVVGVQARPEIMTVDQLKPGLKGTSKSVFHGTEIEEFDITVLGVLEGFDFGLDLILIRIDSGPVVDEGWGLCGGMSGSPVYVEGKLIGAISYGLTYFPKAPLAGVTPIASMLESFAHREREQRPAASASRPNHRAAARNPAPAAEAARTLRVRGQPLQLMGQVFREAQVFATDQPLAPVAPGTLAFTPIATPLMVNGLGSRGERYLEKVFEPFPVRPHAVGSLGPAPPEAEFHLEPGAAVGVQLCRGAIDVSGIGTLTYLDDDVALAFGHPMLEFGAVDLPLTGAYIHTIWPSLERSEKIGAPLEPIGSILEDRLPAVGGFIGRVSEMLPADITVKDADRDLTRQYHLEIMRHKNLTSGLLSSLLSGAIDMTTSPMREGVTRLHLEVQPKDYPVITRDNLFSSGGSGGMSLSFLLFGGSGPDMELASILGTLSDNPFGEVRVESVQAEIEVREEHRTAEIEQVYPEKTTVEPGETIDLAVYLKPYERPSEIVHVPLHIPANTPAGPAIAGVVGGESQGALGPRLGRRKPVPINRDQLLESLQEVERNDELVVLLHLLTVGLEMEGVQLSDLPVPVSEVLRSVRARNVLPLRDVQEEKHPQNYVLSGAALLRLTIKAKEEDKVSPIIKGLGGGEEGEGMPMGMQMVMESSHTGKDPVPTFLATFDRLAASLMPLASENSAVERPSRRSGALAAEEGSPEGGASPGAEGSDKAEPEEKEEKPPAEIPDVTEELKLDTSPEMPTWDEVEAIEKQEGAGEKPDEQEARKSEALARAPQVWDLRTVKDYAGGEFEGTYLDGAGQLCLAPDFQPLRGPETGMVWKQVVDADGNLYLGSWAPGIVYRTVPGGNPEPYFQSEELALHALAVGPDGVLYAGSLPSCQIYKITAANEATVLATLPEKYIWELVCQPNGDLYAATGNEGKLYRIQPDGTAEVVFTARDRHLLALTPGPEQTLYVGTYPNGKIYRVTTDTDKPVVTAVYEVPDAAVSSLAVTEEGRLYVGTSPKGALYKIEPSGAVKQLGKEEGESSRQEPVRHVYRLIVGADGALYAACGSNGRIYRIDPDDTVSTLYDPEESFVSDLARGEGQTLYATYSGVAQRARLNLGRTWRGEYLSEVRDAGFLARWGQLRWSAELPPGTQVTLQTRSGNTRYPDASWSDWSEEYAATLGVSVTSPAARYLQCRANLYGSSEGARPVLRRVQLFYLTKNRAPDLTEVTVGKQTLVSGKVNVHWTAKDPDNDTLTYESFYSSDGETWQLLEEKKEEPDKAAGEEGTEGEDPEDGAEETETDEGTDEEAVDLSEEEVAEALAAALQESSEEVEAEGTETEESEAAADESGEESEGSEGSEAATTADASEAEEDTGPSKKTSVQWDTTKVADGRYWIRVTVSDRTSNPQEAETDEKKSDPFIVDNTAPVILLQAGSEAIAPPETVRTSDATSYIASAEFKVDKGEWTAAACADRVFDSPYEDIVLNWSEVKPGEHTLLLRVRDAAGNEATSEVKITIPEPAGNG